MPKRKVTTSQQEHSASKEQVETTGTEHAYKRIFKVATSEPVELAPSHEHLEAEDEIDDSITSCLRDLALTGSERGVLIVTGGWNFPGESFPPKLIAIARKGIPEAVKNAILNKTSSFWEPPTKDFGYCKLEIEFKLAHDEKSSATVAAGNQLSEGTPVEHDPRQDQDECGKRLAALLDVADKITASRQQFTRQLEDAVNKFLVVQANESPGEKKDLVDQLRGFLDRLGFALECDGLPCSLYFAYGKKNEKGHYRIIPNGETKYIRLAKRIEDLLPLHLVSSPSPSLKVIPGDPVPDKPSSPWSDRVTKSQFLPPH